MRGSCSAFSRSSEISLDFAANCWPFPRNCALSDLPKTPLELIERLKADMEKVGANRPVCAVWRQVSPGNYTIVNYIAAEQSLRRVRTDASEMLDEMPASELLGILERLASSRSAGDISGILPARQAALTLEPNEATVTRPSREVRAARQARPAQGARVARSAQSSAKRPEAAPACAAVPAPQTAPAAEPAASAGERAVQGRAPLQQAFGPGTADLFAAQAPEAPAAGPTGPEAAARAPLTPEEVKVPESPHAGEGALESAPRSCAADDAPKAQLDLLPQPDAPAPGTVAGKAASRRKKSPAQPAAKKPARAGRGRRARPQPLTPELAAESAASFLLESESYPGKWPEKA